MAAAASLKTFEVDAISPSEVWISIEGYHEREKQEWERMRYVCFFTAASNSDRKKFPKSPQRFMPFPWDKIKGVRASASSPQEILNTWRQLQAEREKQKVDNGR